MIAARESPAEIRLNLGSSEDRLVYVGPSFHGRIFRSKTRPVCYRIVPATRLGIRERESLAAWREVPRPGVALVKRAWQPDPDPGGYVIQYEVEGFAGTLAESLAKDPRVSLGYVAATLRALSGWWQNLHMPLLPMPADIALSANGVCLLPVPNWGPPTVDHVFVEPARAFFMAPEFLRSAAAWGQNPAMQAWDIYCVGVLVQMCFCRFPSHVNPERLLYDAVAGVAAEMRPRLADLPIWVDRVRATEDAIQMGARMVCRDPNVRMHLNLGEVADYLSECRNRMEPARAVREVSRQDALQGFALLQDLLLEDDSYDLLLVGAELAGQLQRPLEAIDFCERAIAKHPDRPDAYEAQIYRISEARDPSEPLQELYLHNSELALQLDARIARDYQQLEKQGMELAAPYSSLLARHYLWRGEEMPSFYDTAADFVHGKIFDDRGKHLPWEIRAEPGVCRGLVGAGTKGRRAESIQQRHVGLGKIRFAPGRQRARGLPDARLGRRAAAAVVLTPDGCTRGSTGS
ncbi:MAG TPA: hypothetical protein VHV55_17070 [Pirellulales bacterium]|nr:hypothetical protein [Pirellulales bacterium]